jgi:hypothetical protein
MSSTFAPTRKHHGGGAVPISPDTNREQSTPLLVPPRRGAGRAGFEPALIPARPELEKFRENLVRAMIKKQMTASDVARAMWGETTNPAGNKVAKGRDRMTHYLSGSTHPSPENIIKLCGVLDLQPEDLAADMTKADRTQSARPVAPTSPPIVSPNYDPKLEGVLSFQIRNPNRVFIMFNKELDMERGFALLEFLRKHILIDTPSDPPDEAA